MSAPITVKGGTLGRLSVQHNQPVHFSQARSGSDGLRIPAHVLVYRHGDIDLCARREASPATFEALSEAARAIGRDVGDGGVIEWDAREVH